MMTTMVHRPRSAHFQVASADDGRTANGVWPAWHSLAPAQTFSMPMMQRPNQHAPSGHREAPRSWCSRSSRLRQPRHRPAPSAGQWNSQELDEGRAPVTQEKIEHARI